MPALLHQSWQGLARQLVSSQSPSFAANAAQTQENADGIWQTSLSHISHIWRVGGSAPLA